MQKGPYQDTPPAPFTLGMEIAGVVDTIGPGVSTLKPGDRIHAHADLDAWRGKPQLVIRDPSWIF